MFIHNIFSLFIIFIITDDDEFMWWFWERIKNMEKKSRFLSWVCSWCTYVRCGFPMLRCDARWNWKITKTMNREIKYNIDFHSVISFKIRSFIHFIHNIAEERSANHGFCLRWDEIGGVGSWAWCLWKSKPPNYYDSSFIISFLLKNFNYVLFLMLLDVSSL